MGEARGRPESSVPANRVATLTYSAGEGFNQSGCAWVSPQGVVPAGAVQASLPGTRSGNMPSGFTRARTITFPGMNR
jgi:hypothetical protein